MSDADNVQSVEAELAAKIAAADEDSSTEPESDASAETEEVSTDEEANETDSEAAEETDSEEVEFNFKDTPTSTDNLVNKLANLSDSDRAAEISRRVENKNTRQKEIDAMKEAFPEAFEKESPVSRKEYDQLLKKLEGLEKLDNLESTQELLAKLETIRPNAEKELRDRMLKDQFGDDYSDVLNDAKFLTAMDKYKGIDLEERLEIACTLSPAARKLAVNKRVATDAKMKATKTPKTGKKAEAAKPEKVTGKDLLTAEGMAKALGDKLAALDD